MVWFFTDDKPGHLNQLKGLESRLFAHANIDPYWVSVSVKKISWVDAILKRISCDGESVPDLVVGTGSATHKYLVAARRKYHCLSLVLMKPSLPLWLFDAAVIPEHDNPPTRDNILITTGVLNNVVPRAAGSRERPSKKLGLILIGGASKHYIWDDDAILQQVESVITRSAGVDQWVLGNSRRTPESFLVKIKKRQLENVDVIEHQTTDSSWLPCQMASSQRIWVTPDSVSMVYEAITSGAETSIFELEPKQESRIVRGVNSLLGKNLISKWPVLDSESQQSALWEADRAAVWVLERISCRLHP